MPNAMLQPPQEAPYSRPPSIASGSPAAIVGPEAVVLPGEVVPGIALIATRRLQNEELFLNYRSAAHLPRGSRPSGYCFSAVHALMQIVHESCMRPDCERALPPLWLS